jgi:prolyl-tRNA editing enzyme YbaK/EbsC (Cys-tRNA(Pro) deacylase)
MSVQIVREYLKPFGLDHRVTEFSRSSATVELAAETVGVIGARIAKSLTFKLKGDGAAIMLLTAGDAKVDNAKYRRRFGCKAAMLSAEEVLSHTGHPVGGVCPFALADAGMKVYLDVSLQRFDTVFPAAGSDASAVELTCEELFSCSNADEWVDICKGWQTE